MSGPGAPVCTRKLVLMGAQLPAVRWSGRTGDCCCASAPCRRDIRDKLMFGESNMGDAGHQGCHNKAAAMLDTDEARLQRCHQVGTIWQGHQGEAIR